MQSLSTAKVTSVKRQRRRRNKETARNVVHVTRIQPSTLESAKKMTESTRTGENIQISPAMSNVPLIDSESQNIGRTPTSVIVTHIAQSQPSRSAVDKHPTHDLHVPSSTVPMQQLLSPPTPPMITGTQNTSPVFPSASHSFSSKVFPVNEHEEIGSIALPTRSAIDSNLGSFSATRKTVTDSKSILFRAIDRRQLYTIGAQNKKKKKTCNFVSKCSPFRFLLLGLLLTFLLAGVAVAPVLLLASKAKATVTTSTTSISTNPSTSSMSVSTSTISTLGTTSVSSTSSRSTTIASTIMTTTTNPSTTTTLATTITSVTSTSASSSSTSTVSTTAATVTITSNICTSTWSGIAMIASCTNCTYYPMYYVYPYNYTAIGNTTRIAFALRKQAGYFALDDVSVRNFATPNTEILVNGGFEFGDLTSWAYCDQSNASNTGGVISNSSNFSYLNITYSSHSGSYYYVGGNPTSTDYISQTFSTKIGDQYSVNFAVMNANTGPLTSGYYFLGT